MLTVCACAWIQKHCEYGLDKVKKKVKKAKATPRCSNTATMANFWGRAQVSF